jgi:hypothetical protein
MADNKENPSENFSPGPGPDHYQKFQIGAAVDLPTSQRNAPDVRGHYGLQEDDSNQEDWRKVANEQRRLEEPFYGLELSFKKMVAHLENYDDLNLPSRERQELEINIQNEWETIMHSQLLQTEDVIDTYLFRFKSPYPYDTRQQDYWFERHIEGVKVLRKGKRGKDEGEWKMQASKDFMNSLELDLTWGKSNFQILEGMGVVLPYFFDTKLMLEWIKDRNRLDPTITEYEHTFAATLPGHKTDMDPSVKRMLPDSFQEGLRKKAIDFQDKSVFWRMSIAAVHQMEYDEAGNRKTFMRDRDGNETLTDQEVKFIQYVFGEQDETKWVVNDKGHTTRPETILNYYASEPTEETERKYISRMSIILTSNDIRDKVVNADNEEIKRLASEVVDKADKRRQDWYAPGRSLDTLLADVVVKSGIVADWGHMSAGDMGWGWSHYVEDGIPERKRETGSVYRATDVPSAMYWRDFVKGGQSAGYTSSSLMPAMDDKYIKKLDIESPDWKSGNLEQELRNDPVLKKAWERLWSGNWDTNAKANLQNMVWFWETPHSDPRKNTNTSENIKIPFFFPPTLESLNFFNAVSDKGKLQKGAPPIWEQLCKGEKLSQIEWNKMTDQSFSRWLVTVQQQVRFYTVMVDPTGDRGYWEDFFAKPAKLFELNKRINLGVRDEKIQSQIMALALLPQLSVLKLADQYGIISYKGQDSDIVGDMTADLAHWIVKMKSFPEESGGIVNYNDSMVKMAEFYYTLITRYAKVVGDKKLTDVGDQNKKLISLAGEDASVKVQWEDPKMVRK